MSLNCNEINLILSELNLSGNFIQDILQPSYDALCLSVYGKEGAKTVFICTAQNACRINETKRKITKNDKPLRFMEFLKSRIKGSKIVSVEQIGLDRIIRFSLEHQGEKFFLYARLWNNAANVILCDENNKILDLMFRRPNKNEMKGEEFLLPSNEVVSSPLNDHISSPTNDPKYPIRSFDELNMTNATFNEKVNAWYSEKAENFSRNSLLQQAEKWYEAKKAKMKNALNRLEQKRTEFSNASQLKHQGDLIMANVDKFSSDSNFIEVEDYENGGLVRILIDKNKTPYENATNFYENYKKAQSGISALEHDIALSKKQIEKLDELYNEIVNEKNPIKIEQLLRKDTKPLQAKQKKHPGLGYCDGDWYIMVGRDANENDELLRHYVRGMDLWLHTRDFPGGYVFVKNRPGKTVPLDILLDAGNLALYFSKARSQGKADLYYTHVKYLRRAKNGPKGLVLPTHEKNLFIKMDNERLTRLDEILKDGMWE